MKVLLLNPPTVRSAGSSPENGFALDGRLAPRGLARIPYAPRVWRALGLGGTIRYGVRAGSRWPWSVDEPMLGSPAYPFFLAYAASIIQAEGHAVELHDAVAEEEYDYDRYAARVLAARPDLILLECSTPTLDIDLWMAARLAEAAPVALAGQHFASDALAQEALSVHPNIRFVLRGEYILGARELVRTMRPGVYAPQIVTDLDEVPLPFRAYPAARRYFDPTMPTPRPQLQLWASKGCPFKCTFCAWPQVMFEKKVSLRKPESVAAEIRAALALHPYRSLFFDDDTFNMNADRVSRLCEELKAIGLPWTMMGRIDISPDWLYDKMVDSGCVGMRFGVETFELSVLARVKKGIERVDFRAALERLARRHGHLYLHLTMMRDMPGQTEAMHQEDLRILREMGFSERDQKRSYQLSHCAPFPGTALYEEMKAEKGELVLLQYQKYDGARATVMSEGERE
jgi:anaerobic magnesium-protoporphyrin IX monomethyl ester cyclase